MFSFSLGCVYSQISFDQAGFGVSYWLRNYSTPDERILLTNPPSGIGEINPVVVPNIFGRIGFGNVLGLRGRIGLARDTFESSLRLTNITRQEKINQTVIPTSLMLDFKFPLKSKSGNDSSSVGKISLMGGIGVNRYFIQHNFSRQVVGADGSILGAKFTGNDFGLGALLGISYDLAPKMVFTLFSQYNTGTYLHRLYSEEVIGSFESKRISIQGIEFGINVGYSFGK